MKILTLISAGLSFLLISTGANAINDSTAQGYDVYLRLNWKDDNHVTGTMLDMFDAEGDRAKKSATP